MLQKKTLEKYEKEITMGRLFLVRNRLLNKVTEWRYIGDSMSSDDAYYKARILSFNTTQPHYEDKNFQRYEYSAGLRLYNHVSEGTHYFLVLRPLKKDSTKLSVIAIFPCETTILTPALQAALHRDAALTGFPYSVDEEKKDRRAAHEKFVEEYNKKAEEQHKNETPEEKKKRLQEAADQEIYSEITNGVLTKCGLFFLLPMLIIGFILLFIVPFVGIVCLIGVPFIFLLIAILLIVLKRPLIAAQKRRLRITE